MSGPLAFLAALRDDWRSGKASDKLAIVSDMFTIVGVSIVFVLAKIAIERSNWSTRLSDIMWGLALLVVFGVAVVVVSGLFSMTRPFFEGSKPGMAFYIGIQVAIFLFALSFFLGPMEILSNVVDRRVS